MILRRDPNAPWALGLRGLMQVDDNTRDADAIALLERGWRGAWSIPGLTFTLAQRYRRLGRHDDAIAAYHTALRQAHPNDRLRALEGLADVFIKARRLKSGRATFDNLLRNTPETSQSREFRAYIQLWLATLHEGHQHKQAFAFIKDARRTLGDHPAVHYHHGRVNEARRHFKSARTDYLRALDVDATYQPARKRIDRLDRNAAPKVRPRKAATKRTKKKPARRQTPTTPPTESINAIADWANDTLVLPNVSLHLRW